MPSDPLVWRAHILAINLGHRLPGQIALRELIVLYANQMFLTILMPQLRRSGMTCIPQENHLWG